MLENGLKTAEMMIKLKKIRLRVILTFSLLFVGSIIYLISYVVCEMQELIFEELHNQFTAVSKTVQLII